MMMVRDASGGVAPDKPVRQSVRESESYLSAIVLVTIWLFSIVPDRRGKNAGRGQSGREQHRPPEWRASPAILFPSVLARQHQDRLMPDDFSDRRAVLHGMRRVRATALRPLPAQFPGGA